MNSIGIVIGTIAVLLVIVIALWIDNYINKKEVVITINPGDDDIYMTLHGCSNQEKREIELLLTFELHGIQKKLKDYENKKKEREIEKINKAINQVLSD